MTPILGRVVIAALSLELAPVLNAQATKGETGSIVAVDATSGLVTVVAAGQPAQRYEFVAQAALRARLRPGQSVTLSPATATGQLGRQTLRMQSVLTQVSVTPKVRIAQLCAALEAAMNAAPGEALPGAPTVLWTCAAEPVSAGSQFWCRCTPHFSF